MQKTSLVDWYDCFFLDWALFANVKRIRLPGTEHMDKAYHQKKYHVVIGMVPGLVPCLLCALIVAALGQRTNRAFCLSDEIGEIALMFYSGGDNMGQIANRMLMEVIFKAKEKLKEKKKNENRKQSENDGKQKK